jgi:multicomponent Na+:H+ antiporter subunit D
MTAEMFIAMALAAPFVAAVLVVMLPKPPGLRDTLFLLGAFGALVGVGGAFAGALSGEPARIVLAQPLPHVQLAFAVEPLGALASLLVCALGFLHAVHTIGMARAQDAHDQAHARQMALILLTVTGTVGVALAANLLSMFIAYQVVVMAAFPLVAIGGREDGRDARREFLSALLLPAMGLLLPAIVWTHAIAGSSDFQPGGILAGSADGFAVNALLVLYVLGFSAAGVPPFHGWVASASSAPHASLPTLYSIAVIPAGVVCLMKVAVFVFGPALLEARLAAQGLIVLVSLGAFLAALLAAARESFAQRLAYLSMAQALAAVCGLLLAVPSGVFAAVLQLLALAVASCTLLMAIGTVEAVTARGSNADFVGLGRVMPWTFVSFGLAAASLIGLPPFAGAWAKLWLITAAASTGAPIIAALIGAAAVLAFAQLGPVVAGAFAARAPSEAFKRPDGASFWLVAPVFLGALGTLVLLVAADPLAAFLSPVWAVAP